MAGWLNQGRRLLGRLNKKMPASSRLVRVFTCEEPDLTSGSQLQKGVRDPGNGSLGQGLSLFAHLLYCLERVDTNNEDYFVNKFLLHIRIPTDWKIVCFECF